MTDNRIGPELGAYLDRRIAQDRACGEYRAALTDLLAAAEWLREDSDRRNPHRKRSHEWENWESQRMEEFSVAQSAMERAAEILRDADTTTRPL